MKHKRKPISDKIRQEEELRAFDPEAFNKFMDYFTMNGVEILRGNPIYVNGLKRLIPDKDLRDSFRANSQVNEKLYKEILQAIDELDFTRIQH